MYQIEAKIISIEASYRPRKNLTVYVQDVTGDLKLRFINFYPSQIKQFEEGKILRFMANKIKFIFIRNGSPQI